MEENKIPPTFLHPTNFNQSPTNSIVPTTFPICPISQEIGLTNYNVSPRQVPITQIYASRKIKHPSFRKRASSGSMPYYIPFRHRQRTKSENADAPNAQQSPVSSMDIENVNDKNSGMDIMTMEAPLHHIHSNPLFHKIKLSQLKKSKSMESLLPPSKADDKESKVNASSTLEFVSSLFIQKLKFNE